MKNIYFTTKNKLQFLVALVLLIGAAVSTQAQVRVGFTQRTSSYTPTKKIYNIKGNFTMLGNTCLSPQNYGDNTNNNGQYMQYVDTDGNPNTLNSSASTLVLSTENGAVPACSNIIYAGLYWTGKSSASNTFTVTKTVPISGTQPVNNDVTVAHNQNLPNSNYSLSVGRNDPSSNNRNPYYNFTGNGNTYRFNFYNAGANPRVTVQINGGAQTAVAAAINSDGSIATFNTPYTIADGTVTVKIKSLTRNPATNLSTSATQNSSFADVNVTGTVSGSLTVIKNFDKRVISLKGPAAASYTQFTAGVNDIYYPSGTDDDIYTAYTEITDYVRTNGIGQYWAADMALLEGNVGGTGYAGGWGIIVVYENSKMKYRDVTIFDGYAYVNSGNNSALDLPVTGFNAVQVGNVGMTLGIMASEGDVAFTGDYFKIRKLNTGNYQTLDHGGSTASNFFNSSINWPGARNPQLQNNTAIDILMVDVPNPNNSVIGNNQTSTNFQYGTDGDTYSIFAIAMAVDAYIPDSEGNLSAVSINGQPAGAGPYSALPGQDLRYKIQIKNRGTEAINNFKVTVPVPYNTTYVPGSASRSVFFTPSPTPNSLTFEPTIGANGSLIWDLGTLPLPANGNPETLLGEMFFTFKVTTDCTLLKNTNCNNVVSVNGAMSGTGAITGIVLSNKSLIQGYTSSGSCQGTEIAAPLNVTINAQDFVNQNCQAVPPITAFTICNSGPTIPITVVSGSFPPGSTYWAAYPVVVGQTAQYTINNPFPSTVGTSTYYAIPPGVLTGCYFQFTITVTTITSLPTVTNVDYCVGAAASPLTAVPSVQGYTLYYYNSLNGSAQTSITPSTATVGQTTYYVAEAQSATCIGPKKPIVVNVYAIPAAPVASSVTQPTCSVATGSVNLTGLPVIGNWTINQTGTVNATINGTGANYTISGLAAGSYTFTVTANSCVSPASVNVTINPQPNTPNAPVSGGNQTVCQSSPIQTLTATATAQNGETVVWYTAETGGTVVANPTLNTVGSVTYYAQANNAATCSSATRTPVTLTINAAPAAPTATASNITECEQSPIQTLTATASVPSGTTLVWYTAATGGTVVANPTLNTVGTVTYYAQANVTDSSCTSLTRTGVTLTITPAPVAPTATASNITECEQSPIQTLTATATAPAGATVVWYTTATGGNIVANPTLNTVGTVTYYAQANSGSSSCTSLTRTAVTLTITPAPVAPTATASNITECEQSPIQTLTATATAPAGAAVVWYDAATGGNIVANPTLNTVGTVTYYAQANSGSSSCTSLTRTAVTLTITPAPVAPTATASNITECEQSPIQTLTATATAPAGAAVVWYDAATGGNVVASPTLNTVGTVTYYAQANNGNSSCTSLTRTAVTLTITDAPVSPTVSASNLTECEQSPIQTLTATATAPAGATVVWYTAATGGTVVANPTLNTVGTVTYYAQASGGSCSSLTRTPMTLTITPAPVAPTATASNITECEQSPIQTLTATATAPAGATVVWYTAATGGNIVANPTLNTVGTVTYYAQANSGSSSCTSLTRTGVTLTITPAPVAPTATASNITECEQSPIQTLTATATAPAGATVVWYDAATGGNVVASPTLNTVGTVTYYAQANSGNSSCTSLTRTAVTLTITPAPVAPTATASNITECEQSPIQTLTATASVPSGTTLVWYTAATGGTVVANPILNAVGTVTYYAQADVDATACSSLTRTAVTLTINPAAEAPTVTASDITECEQSPIQTLTATATAPAGATVVWYDAATGGNVVASPTLNTVGTVTYYAQADVDATACSSLTRTAVTLTITDAPVSPVSGGDQTECEQSPIQTLTATASAPGGATIVWYDAATGGNVVASPTLNTVGTVTYYAQASGGSCSSLTRTAVTLTINPAAEAPTVTASDITECEQSPIQTLTATATAPAGATVVWYDAATGGNVVASPTLNTVGTVTYYAQADVDATACSSLTRTSVTLTINPAAEAPTVTASDITECEQSPIQTLTATATAPAGATVVWYDAATGGNIVASPTLNTVGTVTYYAQADVDATACSSLTRTAVTLTITDAPVSPVSGGDQTECEQSPIQTLTATASAPGGATIVWYDAATGGNIVASPTLNTVGTVTYYAQASGGSCSSLTRTSVTLTINPAAEAPTVTASDITECEQSPIQTLTATATAPAGATVVWYDAATGGNVVASPTLNTVGTVTYYAQADVDATACSSLTRTAVTLTINPAAEAPTVAASDITECEQSPIQTLTATATAPAGATVVWYDAATGGNIVANPTLNTVGTVTYYAQADVDATACSSLTRTAVTLTITDAPVSPVSGGDQTECEQSPIQTLTATASAPGGATIVWYDAATGGNVVASPTLNTVGTVTYYAQASGGSCSSLTRTAVTLTINPAAEAPTVTASDITECEQSPIQTLTATATAPAGATVVWYDAATGGNVVASPTLNTVGTVTYYAQADVDATACSSLTRTAVTLTINPAAEAPTVTASDITECEQSPIQTLTATATAPAGATVVWYDAATGGNIVASPTLNTVGTVTYYAQADVNATACSSLTRTAVTLTITDAPVSPVSGGDQTECEQSPIQTLTATASAPGGATIVWYDAATGGNIVASPTLNTVGTVTYYAQASGGSCSSLTRTAVTLTINPAAEAPTVTASDITECEQSPIQTLTATATAPAGATVVWYDAATGGNIVASPTLNTVGTVTYYAQADVDATACSSLTRTSVTLTINPAAEAPTVAASDITECEQSPIQTLTATATAPAGATVVWYDAATGGNIVASPTLNTVGTVTYYAQADVDATACSSLTRTAVTLTINPAAEAPTVTASDITECEQSPIQTLTATATAPAGATVVWYDAATGGNVVASPTLNTVGTVTYYAQADVDATACSSLTRTAVTLTITDAPVSPVSGGDQTECEQSPIQTLTATASAPGGATIVWYDAATGGNVVASPTLNSVGTVTYYAQASGGSCSSLTRTAVTLTINPAAEAPTVTASDITECEQSPIQTLTATATAPAGATVVWYDAATGGNVVASPTLNTVGTVTYYAQADVDATACSSLTRTSVTLTITTAPDAPISGGDLTECEESPIQTLTAAATVPSGFTVVWYDAATGGNVVANPTLSTVGTVTYYAEANGGSCSSLTRTSVTLTINPAAEAPTVTASDITECEQSPIQTLTATATAPAGATVVWYDAATGGNIVASPTLNTVGTVTYYAQADVDATACASLTRTAVTLTINPAAEAPTVTASDITECALTPIQTLTATATVPVTWYDAPVGGSVVTSPTLNTVGTVTYYAEATTAEGCTSLTRTAVTLTINAAPVAPTIPDVVEQCIANIIPPANIMDNCGASLTPQTSSPLSYSNQGTYTITWDFVDAAGNIIVSATQTVTVDDTIAPVIPTLTDVTGLCSATVPVPTTTDNCAGTITGTTSDPLNYNGEGTYVVTWTFDDGNGNVITVSQNVVIDNTTAPSIPVLSDLSGECSVTVPVPVASNACTGATITGMTSDPLFYDVQGTYMIHWSFDDGDGNIVNVIQNVTVDDTTAPVVPTLADVTGQCSATVTPPMTTDNCAGALTATTTDPLTYNTQGSYVVHWTFDDGNGNTIMVSQTVIVDDTTAPDVPVLADVTGSCSVTLTAPATTDNCVNTPIIGTTTDPLTYGPGTYVVTWTFDDGYGNTSTATQNVTVTDGSATTSATGYLKCNTDIDLNLDLNTLLGGLPAGGTWTDLSATSHFDAATAVFDPAGEMNPGLYNFQYVVTDGACVQTLDVQVEIDDDCDLLPCGNVEIHNAFSPNNDGINEWFQIDEFGKFDECYPTNTVEIYNRWGILVFETNQYDNATKVFRGKSEGRATVGGEELPTGTYFYIVNWTDKQGRAYHKEGYLYLSR